LSLVFGGKSKKAKSCPNPDDKKPARKNEPQAILHNASYTTACFQRYDCIFGCRITGIMYFGLKPNSPDARPLRYDPIILPLHSGILMAAHKTTKKEKQR